MAFTNSMNLEAIEHFEHMQQRAQWARWWHRLRGRPETLLAYGRIHDQLPTGTVMDRGVQPVPLEAITGSFGRAEDFDPDFRPFSSRMRDRWVSVHHLHETKGWDPIVVCKVGDSYFVVDGNHRVSVAHEEGLLSIDARVYEYALPAGIHEER